MIDPWSFEYEMLLHTELELHMETIASKYLDLQRKY